MEDKGDAGNAFAIPYLLTPDKTWEATGQELHHVLGQGPNIGQAFTLIADLVVNTEDRHYPWRITKGANEFNLHLPTLESFDTNTPELEYLTTSEFSATSSQLDLSLSLEVDGADIWEIPNDTFQSFPQVNARNWESFHDKNYRLPLNAYISEAGPGAFDSLLDLGTVPCHNSNTTKRPKERSTKQDLLVAVRFSVSRRYTPLISASVSYILCLVGIPYYFDTMIYFRPSFSVVEI